MAIPRFDIFEKLLKKKFSKVIIIIIVVALLGVSLYFYNQYQSAKNLLQNPSKQTSEEAKALVDKIGKLIELPSNENPTVATVTDVSKLAGQPFFAKAKNGDKVLVYGNANELILYRPSTNKIITVGTTNTTPASQVPQAQTVSPTPLSTNAPTQTPTPTVSEQSLKIVVYNGTSKSGLAKTASQQISAKYSNYTVSTGDSSNSDYQKTVVIDLSGKNSKAALDIASLLGGKTQSSVPSGETKPSADILVILGTDFSSK